MSTELLNTYWVMSFLLYLEFFNQLHISLSVQFCNCDNGVYVYVPSDNNEYCVFL